MLIDHDQCETMVLVVTNLQSSFNVMTAVLNIILGHIIRLLYENAVCTPEFVSVYL